MPINPIECLRIIQTTPVARLVIPPAYLAQAKSSRFFVGLCAVTKTSVDLVKVPNWKGKVAVTGAECHFDLTEAPWQGSNRDGRNETSGFLEYYHDLCVYLESRDIEFPVRASVMEQIRADYDSESGTFGAIGSILVKRIRWMKLLRRRVELQRAGTYGYGTVREPATEANGDIAMDENGEIKWIEKKIPLGEPILLDEVTCKYVDEEADNPRGYVDATIIFDPSQLEAPVVNEPVDEGDATPASTNKEADAATEDASAAEEVDL